MSEIVDKIIIGGGSAGCVLAHRLTEDPSVRVLVLEAGRPDHRLDFRIHMPAALTYPLTSRMYNWWYESGPEPGLQGTAALGCGDMAMCCTGTGTGHTDTIG